MHILRKLKKTHNHECTFHANKKTHNHKKNILRKLKNTKPQMHVLGKYKEPHKTTNAKFTQIKKNTHNSTRIFYAN
jgi:hypothetical protein